MNIDPIIDGYKQSSQTRVGTKNTTDSISPTDVAGCDQDLAEILRTVGNAVNNFDLLGNTLPPLNSAGADDDIYIQGGTTLRFWKKISGAWTLKVSVPLGVIILDGNINLQPRVSGFTITVPPGQWGINNQIYTKAAQDQFNINAADANLDRIDAVFAKTDSTVEYVAGTASANPDTTKPTTPANQVIVTYVYVPSVASGGLPYINDSNGSPTVNPLVLTGGSSTPTGGNDGDVYIQNDGSVVTFYQKLTGTWTAIQNFIIGGGGSVTIATDAELQTQATPAEDEKIVSRHGLIFWWNWIKTQTVNITTGWQFSNIGVGVASGINALISLAVNTASVGQLYIPASSIDYTGSVLHLIWNNAGEFKFLDTGSIVNRFIKLYNNDIFKSDGLYFVTANQEGDLSANIKAMEAWVFDVDLISAITSATYTSDRATISVTDKTLEQGSMYDDGTYTYFAIDDNVVRRW